MTACKTLIRGSNPLDASMTQMTRQQIEPPPLTASFGCGLLVASLVAVLYTCVGLWVLSLTAFELMLNIYIAGPEHMGDVLQKFFIHLASSEFTNTFTIVLSAMFGLLIAAAFIATADARKFMTWLRRR
jgi:hypothetical protein